MTAGHIPWGKFKVYHCEDSDLDSAPAIEFPFIDGSRFKAVNTGIDEPGVQINYEDFVKGDDIVWTVAHDEVQYVVSGEAEITYHLPPLMLESGTVTAKAGSVYLIPRGCRIVWRVTSDEPFRHLCICFPNPGYPIEVAPSAKES